MVEFVNYDGTYPCLCMGVLTVKIDDKEVKLPRYCIYSNGETSYDFDYSNEYIVKDKWSVNEDMLPEEYKSYKTEIEDCVNKSVPWGCCGGCL